MMKTIPAAFIVILFCFIPEWLMSQKQETNYFLFDKNGNPSNKIENAAFFGVQQKLADTAWQWLYYQFSGPLVSVETYRDSEMKYPHGYFAWFDRSGIIDSSGSTYMGRKDGTWYHWTDSLTVWKQEDYEKGRLIRVLDEAALKARREQYAQDVDTSLFQLVEREAEFPGGTIAWVRFLQKNLQFPQRAIELDKEGTVVVSFMVNINGKLDNIRLAISREYSLDEEALRLLKKSPGWNPAVQGDRKVNAYRRQPITFALQ